jgi:HAD superfamily hydrolase (TIGR01662 family)
LPGIHEHHESEGRSLLKTTECLTTFSFTKSYEPLLIACFAFVISLLKAVFLDLGDTLVHLDRPWEDVFHANLQQLYTYLTKQGLKLDSEKFAKKFVTQFDNASDQSSLHKIEIPMEEIISKVLTKSGLEAHTIDLPTNAMIEFFRPEIEAWQVYPDTVETLTALEKRGYTMGVISNAKSDYAVHAILHRRNLDGFFKTIVSSAAMRLRKPRPEIFTQALNSVGVTPSEAIFVGDSMEADVAGSRNMGMRSIHLLRKPIEGNHLTKPDASVTSLAEAVTIILNWADGSAD